jgi:hypothetical protein
MIASTVHVTHLTPGSVNPSCRREFEEKVTATANYHKVERAVVESRVRTCEKCTGQLLRCCFAAVESLQTTDMPLLTRYAASILAHTQTDAYTGRDGTSHVIVVRQNTVN